MYYNMLRIIFQENIEFFPKYLKFNIDILKKILYNNDVKMNLRMDE